MSNTFSVRPKQDELMKEHLLQDFYKEYEIGQSSVGWKFLFFKGITLRKMRELSEYYDIVDEYGDKYTYQEFAYYVLHFKYNESREGKSPYDWHDKGDYDMFYGEYDIPEWWEI